MIWGVPLFLDTSKSRLEKSLGKCRKMWKFKYLYIYIYLYGFHFVLQDSNPISTVCSDVDGMPLRTSRTLVLPNRCWRPSKGQALHIAFRSHPKWNHTWLLPFRPTSSALSLLLNLWSLHHCPNHGPPLHSFSEEAPTASGFVVRPIIPYCWRMLERLCGIHSTKRCKVESDSKTRHLNQ